MEDEYISLAMQI